MGWHVFNTPSGSGMMTVPPFFDDNERLPEGVIRDAAREWCIRILFTELDVLMSHAADALAHDCEIDRDEARLILGQQMKRAIQRLPVFAWNADSAAIFWGFEIEADEDVA